jgi:hypothetical protein
LCLFATSLLADTQSSTNTLALIPERELGWNESLLWDKDVTLRTGVGYKDNVLLSPSAPQGSGFFASGLDLSLIRLPLDGLELSLTATGDDTHYWRNTGISREDLALVSARVQKYFGGVWRGGLELRYVYLDQVLEELVETGGLQPVIAQGNTLRVRPFLRRDLGTNWWLQLELPISREWLQSPLDDDWNYGAQVSLGRDYGHRSELALTVGGAYVAHDEWLARDSLGTEIPDRKLAIWRQITELKWVHQWDAQRRWRSTTKLGFQSNWDNGGGYFDYYQYRLSEELRFQSRDWEIKGTAGVSYYNFPVQTVAAPPSPTLYLTSLDVTFRVERRLYRSLHCFAMFEHEQTLSNDPTSEFNANVTTGGLSWEF